MEGFPQLPTIANPLPNLVDPLQRTSALPRTPPIKVQQKSTSGALSRATSTLVPPPPNPTVSSASPTALNHDKDDDDCIFDDDVFDEQPKMAEVVSLKDVMELLKLQNEQNKDAMRDLIRDTTANFLQDKYGEGGLKANRGGGDKDKGDDKGGDNGNNGSRQAREALLPVIRLKPNQVMLKGTGWANYYDWLRDLENLVTIHLHIWTKYPEAQKIAIVEATFATEFIKQYVTIVKPTITGTLTFGETLTYDDLIKGIEAHIRRIRNVLSDRCDLFKRTQNPGETYREFEAELLQLGKNAELPLSEEDLLTTLIIKGVRDDRLRNKLLTE